MEKASKNIKLIIICIMAVVLIIIAIIIALNYNKAQTKNETSTIDSVPEEKLNSDELKSFSNYFNDDENNGFLLSNYENVSDIDITEVFNNGAGLNEKITDTEKEEYLKTKNRSYLVTNVVVFDKTKAEELFKEKTGEKLDNIVEKLNKWVYLKNENKFCSEKGDTNKRTVNCTSGTKKLDTYTIKYTLTSGTVQLEGIVTLLIDSGKYLFQSNEVNL